MLRKWFVVALITSLIMTACKGGGDSPKTVKIAVSLPTSLSVGEDMLKAAQLALDEAGGKAGKITVELFVINTADLQGGHPISTDLEREGTLQAIEDSAVVAYLGPLATTQAKVSMPLLNEASITQISASTTWPGLTKPGYGPGEPGIYYPAGRRHFFRVVPSDEVQGAAGARWARQLGIQSAYLVNEDTAYGNGVAGIFEITAKDLGISILGHDIYDPDAVTTEEFEALAARVVQAGPDLLYLGGATSLRSDELVGAVRKLEPGFAIMGPDALAVDDLIAKQGADLVEGVYGTAVVIPAAQLDSAAAAALLKNFQTAYNKEPSPFAVSTYEAMKVLLHAIERAKNPTREDVLDTMRNLGEFSGVFGNWRFDDRGDISLTAISGMQIQDGVWTFVQVIR